MKLRATVQIDFDAESFMGAAKMTEELTQCLERALKPLGHEFAIDVRDRRDRERRQETVPRHRSKTQDL